MIYLDHHSTCPIDPRVLDAMMPYLTKCYGNAASFHEMGEIAAEAVERARASVAKLIDGANPRNIHFTSGATEANNIAILGFRVGIENSWREPFYRPLYITSPIEHMSILTAFEKLNVFNRNVTKIKNDGIVSVEDLENAMKELMRFQEINSKISLVSIMTANNEIGTIQPIKEIKKLCDKYEAIFHTDAVQAAGKVKLSVEDADIITLSSHKIYGPKGIGAIYINDKVIELVKPIIHGGFQEVITSGTSNVPAIVGFGKAAEIIIKEGPKENIKLSGLRDKFLSLLQKDLDVKINGSMSNRLPHNLNISIPGVKAEVLTNIKGLCLSTGSACKKTGRQRISHVIEAIKADKNSVRFGFGRFNTEEEIELAANKIIKVVKEIL